MWLGFFDFATERVLRGVLPMFNRHSTGFAIRYRFSTVFRRDLPCFALALFVYLSLRGHDRYVYKSRRDSKHTSCQRGPFETHGPLCGQTELSTLRHRASFCRVVTVEPTGPGLSRLNFPVREKPLGCHAGARDTTLSWLSGGAASQRLVCVVTNNGAK
jgi:hypothetical protein